MTVTVKEYQKHQCDEVEGALKVIAPWLSRNNKIKIKPCQGTPHADIDKGIIYVPPMNGMSHNNLWLARAFFYHESAHILSTKMNKKEQSNLNKALFTILNSLEDYRIEKKLSSEHKGAETVFRWSRDYFSSKIAQQIAEEEVDAPLWEALAYMQLTLGGGVPKWYLTDTAQAYYDIGWETYQKVRNAKNTNDCLNIANELYELFKQAKRDMQNDAGENPPQGGEQDQNQNEEQNEKQDQNQNEEQNECSGSASDMPDEDEASGSEDDKSESDNGDGSETEEADENEGSEEGEKQNDESGEGLDSEESDNGDESSEDSGDGSSDESSNSSTNENGEYSEDGKKPNKNKKSNIDTSNGNSDGSGDVNEKDIQKELEELISKELDEDSDGEEVSEMLQNDLDEVVKKLNKCSSLKYNSMRENDEFIQLDITQNHREAYTKIRREVSSAVSGMSRSLEQALRAMAQTNKRPMMPRGKLDHRRLATMAKSLSKHVFYETDPGQKLNTSVVLVVDESGSMCRISDEVTRVVAAICESMNNINVPFEVYGTTTKYSSSSIPSSLKIRGYDRTNPLQVRVYKTFGENWINVCPRVSQFSHHQHNADGEIIELAAARLQNRPEERKIILSVCDGIPDAGHGNNDMMGDYLKNVCQKVRSQNIEVYGFGINTSEPKMYYGKKNFIYLDGVTGLNNTFFREFSRIITDGKVKM